MAVFRMIISLIIGFYFYIGVDSLDFLLVLIFFGKLLVHRDANKIEFAYLLLQVLVCIVCLFC